MGIAVKELLSLEYFKDFQVIAGKQGVEREIQGITILDAPDGFRWTVGKELVCPPAMPFPRILTACAVPLRKGIIKKSPP